MLDSLPKNEVANEDMLGIIHRGLDRYWKKVLDVHLKCPPTRASCQSPLASHPFPNAREAPGSSTVGHPCALPQHLHQPRNSFPQTLPSPRTGRQHKHLPVARTHRSSALPNPKCCRRFILRYRVTFVHEDQQGRSDQGVVSEHAFERQASISKMQCLLSTCFASATYITAFATV